MAKKRIDFITMGCSKNLVDTELLMRQFAEAGYDVKHDAKTPTGRIVIINTCGFIGDAKEESINTILQFAERKQKGKIDKLFVMGCLPERYKKELQAEIPEVDRFYGKFEYPQIITDMQHTWNHNIATQRTLTTPKHYAYLKISEGCNRTCSYCAIPIITGHHKSRSMEDILQEVKWLTSKGVKEFQIIAQDLSYYGIDLYKKTQLAELINRIADTKGVEWIRLHYAYPAKFPYDILKVMRERDNVCNYLDIALQHISNHMLQLMRRNITSEETYQLLQRIREEVPEIHLRTTLLLGHPGETEDDVQQLEQFVQKARFERLGAFAYSDEDGTYANLHYQDNIPMEEKEQRVARIMQIQENIAAEINAQKIGKTMPVIIDRQEGEFYIGRTEYDSPDVDGEVLIGINKPLKIGNIYPTLITAAEDFDLFGEVNI